ncbi:DUF2845 domain-containing protein [Thiomonas intermedia]|uniref:DUF2845 domain-containing protein n=1 Tax=Thiomonas intermedia TaxID=926 RepID=UPI001C54CB70|nr:DUF2845 domain-containing protein [Thiomonas intermedia]
MSVAAVLISLIIAWFVTKSYLRTRRLAQLIAKHGDSTVAENILKKRFWVGQTADQLKDSLGSPAGIGHKSLKTKKREVWKYNKTGKNRYSLRVTLDDGVVTNFDQKSA